MWNSLSSMGNVSTIHGLGRSGGSIMDKQGKSR
jgi:hypothetical protein